MFVAWNERKYRNVVASAKWRGRSVGLVSFWKRGGPSLPSNGTLIDSINNATGKKNYDSIAVAAADNLTGNAQYLSQYEGSTINSNGVFLAALQGLSEAAEEGLENRCGELWVHGYSIVIITFTPVATDRFGNPLLRYSHVRKAIKGMVFKMVADKRFQEMAMIILQDGQELARGGCKKWVPPGALGPASDQ